MSEKEQLAKQCEQLDLEDLERQTGAIRENLVEIERSSGDLDDLEKQTDNIVGNLKAIDDDDTNLEQQTGRVLANLKEIAALLEDKDVAEVVEQLGQR